MSNEKIYCSNCYTELLRTVGGFACQRCNVVFKDPAHERFLLDWLKSSKTEEDNEQKGGKTSDQKTYCHVCLSKLIRTPYGFICKKCKMHIIDHERERAWDYLFELKGADKQEGEAMQQPKTHLIVRIWRWLTCKEE